MHLKHPESVLPTVTHSELQGRLPALLPGKMELKKTSLMFSCRRHSRNLLILLRQGSLPREGLQAGETTKGWGTLREVGRPKGLNGASSKGLNRVLSPHPGPEAELLTVGLVLAEELLTPLTRV